MNVTGGVKKAADDKKGGKAGKKGKEVSSSNPLEIKKLEYETLIQKSKEQIVKYEEKLEKLKVFKFKYESFFFIKFIYRY